jgi:hypothetical protein
VSRIDWLYVEERQTAAEKIGLRERWWKTSPALAAAQEVWYAITSQGRIPVYREEHGWTEVLWPDKSDPSYYTAPCFQTGLWLTEEQAVALAAWFIGPYAISYLMWDHSAAMAAAVLAGHQRRTELVP